eukprot:15474009-Alexandrium_andersonii.AAC.1
MKQPRLVLMEEVGATLQLGPVELRRELQVGPRGRRASSDLLLVYPRVVDMDVQAAPIRAWRAANQQEGPARGNEPTCPLTVPREAK